ncbi:MAG: pilus assembly protein PilP [Candidatus Berkiellales bacterium]
MMTINVELEFFDFNEIKTWPWPVKFFIAIVTSVFVLVVLYQSVIKNALSILETRQKEEQALVATLDKIKHSVHEGDSPKQKQSLAATWQEYLLQLPNKSEIPALLEAISAAANAEGLAMNAIRLQTEKEDAFYLELPIEISVQGGYHQLGAFISRMMKLSFLLTLHDFTLHPSNDRNGVLVMSMVVKTYRTVINEFTPEKPNNKNGRRKISPLLNTALDELKSPFLSSPLKTLGALETLTLDSLKMVGIIFKKNKKWALIKDPNNKIHWVTEGNYLGQEQNKISQITEDKIILVENVDSALMGKKPERKMITLALAYNLLSLR